jgi:HAD superfamily hydrolase (TIGR01509 family)
MSKLKGIIFDLDGTIADTEEVHRLAFNAAFHEANLDDWQWTRELYADLLGVAGGRERIGHYVRVYHPEFHPAEFGLDDFVGQLHYAKTRTYQRMIGEGAASLRPGVMRLLNEARAAKLAVAIATSTARANVQAVLTAAFGDDWESLFPVVVTCTELKAQKPAPDVYQHALAELGLTNQEVVAIEDTRNGLLAAVAAGVHTVVTCHFYTRNHDLSEAALVVDHLGDIDQPCTVFAGDRVDKVDLAFLKRLTASPAAHALVA